jgi:hypothetical protein
VSSASFALITCAAMDDQRAETRVERAAMTDIGEQLKERLGSVGRAVIGPVEVRPVNDRTSLACLRETRASSERITSTVTHQQIRQFE